MIRSVLPRADVVGRRISVAALLGLLALAGASRPAAAAEARRATLVHWSFRTATGGGSLFHFQLVARERASGRALRAWTLAPDEATWECDGARRLAVVDDGARSTGIVYELTAILANGKALPLGARATGPAVHANPMGLDALSSPVPPPPLDAGAHWKPARRGHAAAVESGASQALALSARAFTAREIANFAPAPIAGLRPWTIPVSTPPPERAG